MFFILWLVTVFMINILIKKNYIRIAFLVKMFEFLACILFYGFLVSGLNIIFFTLPSIMIFNILIGLLFVF